MQSHQKEGIEADDLSNVLSGVHEDSESAKSTVQTAVARPQWDRSVALVAKLRFRREVLVNAFAFVHGRAQETEAQGSDPAVPRLQHISSVLWQWETERIALRLSRAGLLLGELPRNLCSIREFGNYGKDQSRLRIGTDEGEQSHDRSCPRREDDSKPERENVSQSWGQWEVDTPADRVSVGSVSSDGIRHRNKDSKETVRIPTRQLQSRYSRSVVQTGNRSGRPIAQVEEVEVPGQAQDYRIECVRVDSVTFLERGDRQGFGAVCPDGFVYNIEVEDHHNYFANGTLVHNCHHAVAGNSSYQAIYDRYGVTSGECLHIGCTATAKRADKKSLYAIGVDGAPVLLRNKKGVESEASREQSAFEVLAYEMKIPTALDEGWLVPIRQYTVRTETDLSKVKTQGGDFAQGELAKQVNNEKRTNAVLSAHKQHGLSNRPTLAFCADVQHSKDTAALAVSAGYTAAYVTGETPTEERTFLFDQFKAGKLQWLCNFGIATEGTDLPVCSCVAVLRPTEVWSLFVQMVGRGLRVLPGVIDGIDTAEGRTEAIAASAKPDCVVLDVVDILGKHDICTVPSILDLPADLDLQGQSLAKVNKMLMDYADAAEHLADGGKLPPKTFTELKVRLEAVELIRQSARHDKRTWQATDRGFRYTSMPVGYTAELLPVGKDAYKLAVKFGQEIVLEKDGKPAASFDTYMEHAAKRAQEAAQHHRDNRPKNTCNLLSLKQLNVLKANGYRADQIDKMTLGYAKKVINECMEAYRARQEGMKV